MSPRDDKTMGFEQATIRVLNEREFGDLRAAIEQALSRARIVKYLKALDGRRIRVRDLGAILAANVIDAVAGSKAGTAGTLYGSMPASDQAQIREFYLSKIEEVEPALRAKFSKVYRYS